MPFVDNSGHYTNVQVAAADLKHQVPPRNVVVAVAALVVVVVVERHRGGHLNWRALLSEISLDLSGSNQFFGHLIVFFLLQVVEFSMLEVPFQLQPFSLP